MQNTILQDIYTPQLGGFSVFFGGGGGGGGGLVAMGGFTTKKTVSFKKTDCKDFFDSYSCLRNFQGHSVHVLLRNISFLFLLGCLS